MRIDPVVDALIAAKVPFITMSRSVADGPSNPPIDFVGVDSDRGAFIALGQLAMDLLVEKIQAKTESVANRVLLEPILKIRKTCGALQK